MAGTAIDAGTSSPMHRKHYQPTVAVSSNAGNMPGTEARIASPSLPPNRRKNRLMQVLLIVLAVLLVLALLLVGGWFLILRPYAHSVAQNEVDGIFSSATNLINPLALAIVAASHQPVIITENDANNFIASNSSQSDPSPTSPFEYYACRVATGISNVWPHLYHHWSPSCGQWSNCDDGCHGSGRMRL